MIVDVHAAGVTFPDVLLTRGQYQLKPELPFSPGLEVAGTVRSAPENSPLREGDRVAGLSMFGGFAEQVAVPADHVFPLPDGVEFAAAAALPVNYFTAEFALTHRAGLAEGDTVLVHGAAGGVGTASIQYARARGATVVAVASTDEKAALATEVGAHHTVHPDGFAAAVKGADRRARRRHRRRPGRRRPLHRLAAFARRRRPPAGRRLRRRGDPDGQGEPAAAEQHRGHRRRLGRLRPRPAGLRSAAVGRASPR